MYQLLFYPSPKQGVMWPLEGMTLALRYISYILPTTYAAESIRSIMGRGKFFFFLLMVEHLSARNRSVHIHSLAGWGLSEMDVWRGYLVTFSWFILLLILAAVGLRLHK